MISLIHLGKFFLLLLFCMLTWVESWRARGSYHIFLPYHHISWLILWLPGSFKLGVECQFRVHKVYTFKWQKNLSTFLIRGHMCLEVTLEITISKIKWSIAYSLQICLVWLVYLCLLCFSCLHDHLSWTLKAISTVLLIWESFLLTTLVIMTIKSWNIMLDEACRRDEREHKLIKI